jgi:hypothetical protein
METYLRVAYVEECEEHCADELKEEDEDWIADSVLQPSILLLVWILVIHFITNF